MHVLLNPLPVYGLAIGILALGAALLARSKPAQGIALALASCVSGTISKLSESHPAHPQAPESPEAIATPMLMASSQGLVLPVSTNPNGDATRAASANARGQARSIPIYRDGTQARARAAEKAGGEEMTPTARSISAAGQRSIVVVVWDFGVYS